MLMFDNSIFASFIPQIVMLMGYLMCLIAPLISQLGSNGFQTVTQDDLTSNRIVIESVNISNQVVDYIHFNDVNFQTTDIVEKPELPEPVFSATTISFPEFKNGTGQKCSFPLFSRPPPDFC